ncbi:hypothetical protein UQW22_07145 [Isoptericola halotolerans]|uniref:SHOCT domain-containing protein n=1 Tax=Isoptericola halotolerans TaxID=300560 RepID=UPI00389001C3
MDDFWSYVWFLLWIFLFMAYLIVLFQILSDLFRDRHLNGWWKALWVVLLIFLPMITALVYLIARGRGMAERNIAAAQDAKAATDDYIKTVAGSPADHIASAKKLLDDGTITPEEFEALKSKALA